ncbi:MAG TPA: PLP-dependent aminotransferase family protein [Gemmatimonadales bacterium]|nr:PLP-dependent aminotransferase family protein [Gemmatimonadales bacterium]
MAKQTTAFSLVLPPRPAGMPAAHWLCSALRAEILEGRLCPGARLPATRDLAKQYDFSRGTVVSAFEQLKSEGYLEGSVGSGTYVNQVLPDDLLQVGRQGVVRPAAERSRPRRLSDFGRRARLFPTDPSRPTRAFRADQPALDLFPTTLWAQLAARRLRRATTQLLSGSSPMGHRPLQEAVADYLRTSRGVTCTPDQVAIVSGVQEALHLVARLLLNPGDQVCMENPGYIGAALAFDALGAKVIGVAVDGEGMEVPSARLRDVRLVFVTPGHQSPLGISMSLPRRLALLEWARKSGALIFEDDYDSEYRYAGRPLPALQGLDRHAQVLFAGSFSKVLFSSIRLAYLVVPPDLIDAVTATQSITTRYAPHLDQAVLCDFIVEGHFGRHVRRMREIYAERRSVLLESARQRLSGLFEIVGVEAGLQTAGWLCRGIDAVAAAKAAAQRDVDVVPLSRYSRGPMAREGLQLGFAAVDPEEIRRGVRELAIALEGALRRGAES